MEQMKRMGWSASVCQCLRTVRGGLMALSHEGVTRTRHLAELKLSGYWFRPRQLTR